MRPLDLRLMRYTLAIVWLVTGILTLCIFPQHESLALLAQVGLHDQAGLIALYGSTAFDIALGILTIAYPSALLWRVQIALVLGYSIIITIFLPVYLAHPFGPILKNLPILLLLWLLHKYEREIT